MSQAPTRRIPASFVGHRDIESGQWEGSTTCEMIRYFYSEMQVPMPVASSHAASAPQLEVLECPILLPCAEGGKGDDAFEQRLATLKAAKKQVPYGKSRREEESPSGAAHHDTSCLCVRVFGSNSLIAERHNCTWASCIAGRRSQEL